MNLWEDRMDDRPEGFVPEDLKNGVYGIAFQWEKELRMHDMFDLLDKLHAPSFVGKNLIHEVPPNAKWHKRWVLDLDEDEFLKSGIGATMAKEGSEPCSLDFYAHFLWGRIRAALVGIDGVRNGEAISYMPDISHKYETNDVTLLRTPHGWHIVTPPFNRDIKAMKQFFEVEIPSAWIKPDAMAMLYAPDSI